MKGIAKMKLAQYKHLLTSACLNKPSANTICDGCSLNFSILSDPNSEIQFSQFPYETRHVHLETLQFVT